MKPYLFFCFFIQGYICHSQNDLKVHYPEFNEKLLWFDSIVGLENSGIVNGKIDYSYNVTSIGHRFFDLNEWRSGQIEYDGQIYAVSGVKFDVVDQKVVINYVNQHGFATPLQLHVEKIGWFRVSDHYFQKISFDNTAFNENLSGFYHILYSGNNLNLLSKRKKEIQKELKLKTLQHNYLLKDRYFLIRKGEIFKINRKKDFYKANPENKQVIRKFIRQNNLMIKRNNDEDLIMLTGFCESLMNKSDESSSNEL